MENDSFAGPTGETGRQASEHISDVVNDSFARQETTDSVANDTFAGMPPAEAERMRAQQDRLSAPLLVQRTRDYKNNHEASANIVSIALLFFMRNAQNTAERLDADITIDDIDCVTEEDSAERSHERFSARWADEVGKPNPNLLAALLRSGGCDVFLLLFTGMFQIGMPFVTPVLLTYINEYMVDTDAPMWHGALFAGIFFVAQFIGAVATAQTSRRAVHLKARFEGALRLTVGRTVLGATSDGLQSVGGAGGTFQMFSSDIMRVATLPQVLNAVLLCTQVLAAFAYLFAVVSWPAVGAVFVFMVLLPFNYKVSESFIGVFFQKMMAGDKRTKKIVEIINNIRTVKFYSWERPFVDLVADLREPELVHTSQLMKLIAFIMCSFSVASPLMQLGVYILLIADNPDGLTVVKFFQSLSLIQILSGALTQLPWSYSMYLQLEVGGERLTKLLLADSRKLPERTAAPGAGSVSIKDATFVWGNADLEKFNAEKEPTHEEPSSETAAERKDGESADTPEVEPKLAEEKTAGSRLTIPSFEVAPGELVMVVGKLGGGKTALVNSVLGELIRAQGESTLNGRIAYTPQSAWVINATIRNNIVMQNDFDAERYANVVRAVDLHVDFLSLPNGDLTEIGEKGINLSGGQKQRVSFARALYTDADVYLFDDPLSALDAHVGRHVFETGITKLLAGKTRVLVTHALGFLGAADRVYIADNMTIKKIDKLISPTDLPAAPADEAEEDSFVQLMRAWHGTKGEDEESEPAQEAGGAEAEGDLEEKMTRQLTEAESVKSKNKKKEKKSGALTVQEERQSGHVSSQTLFVYLGSFGGCPFWFTIFLLHVISVGAILFANLWLGLWAGGELPDSIQYKYEPVFYIGIYAGVVFVAAFIVLGREMIWRTGAVNAPRVMYKAMSDSVLRTSMSFFDTTPVGRIINRFTKDSEQLDFALPMATNTVFIISFMQFGSLVSMCYLMPWFTPVAVVLIVILTQVQPTVATVVLRRLSSSLAGPTMALFSETVGGAASIRAAGLGDFFMARFAQAVDDTNAAQLADQMLFFMVAVNVGIIMAFLAAAMLLVVMLSKDSLTPATASFVITQGMNMTLGLGFLMMQRGQLAMSLNSIERLTEYSQLPPEAQGPTEPEDSWPTSGEVELQHVFAQYRPGQPLVLKDVSVTFKGGEKIGVCGRTGSGKSSLLLTLFRLIPLIKDSKLLIDGVDTATMPLESLRSKLSAIPQEPVLFSGSVRENIDPFKRVDDDTMKVALGQCHLLDTISAKAKEGKVENPLDLELNESSLSIGEKQLLCLARALARNQRILVLDEATSSVDPHTDKLIQETIRSAFAHCTVITVAHRLNTIMDCDRVLVLDAGRLAEFDSPSRLKNDPATMFAQLVADAEREDE